MADLPDDPGIVKLLNAPLIEAVVILTNSN